ncbi:hypothetical protein DER44DRAFT_783756 [Fusarium oxysporum]|nr:hypothetical protein DER44DRAFT_783756 [Fusarium oxysporum]
MQLLLDKGADANAQGGQYGNALQAASSNGKLDAVQLLNLNGAKMMPRKRSGSTNIRERSKFPRL